MENWFKIGQWGGREKCDIFGCEDGTTRLRILYKITLNTRR